MSLIELALGFYFTLLLVRALISDEGQIAFNPIYQAAVRLTRPALDRIGRFAPGRKRASSPILLMALIIVLQGFLYLLSGPSARRLDLALRGWFFVGSSPLWAWAKAAAFYLALAYRIFAFAALVLAWKRPEDAYDQFSRIFRAVLSPAARLSSKNRPALPVLLFIVGSGVLAVFWKVCAVLGLVSAERLIPVQSALIAAALFVSLSSIFVWLIFAQALLSWLPLGGGAGRSAEWIAPLTEPVVAPFRRFNLRAGRWDFTPIAAMAALVLGRRVAMIALEAVWRRMMAA